MPVIQGFGRLIGTAGDDELHGSAGADTLEGRGGNDLFFGGAGNDLIHARDYLGPTRVVIHAGEGSDTIYVGSGVESGGGPQTITLDAGPGNDEINLIGQFASGVLDGGDGDDRFNVYASSGDITLRLGAGGADVVNYIGVTRDWAWSVMRIEQFRSGDTGDVLNFGMDLINWDGANPFTNAYLRLRSDGNDTLVEVDVDGGGDHFLPVIRFVNVAPYELTAHNFGGYPPDGSETLGKVFVGSAVQSGRWVQIDATRGPDTITGQGTHDLILAGSGNDLINTAGGDDRIYASLGDDTVNGGSGADTIADALGSNYLRGDDGADSVQGGAGFDNINGNQGNDTASGDLGDDWVVGGKDDDLLFGDAGADLVYGNLGNDTCEGGDGDDIVRGGLNDDVVRGGAGDDYVSGDKGNDTVTGGAGADNFHTFGEAGIDRVLDFSVGDGDRVQLDPGTQYTVAQSGADTVISMTGGGQMVLVGVQMSALPDGWIFGA